MYLEQLYMKLLGHPFPHEKIYFLSFCSVWCVSDNDSCFMQFENLINEFNLNDVYGYKEKQEEKDRKNSRK